MTRRGGLANTAIVGSAAVVRRIVVAESIAAACCVEIGLGELNFNDDFDSEHHPGLNGPSAGNRPSVRRGSFF